jgi:hypothetical protein
MAIAALSARSSTWYRAGRRPLPSGTWPAAPLAALPALNDVPHRPSAGALSVSPPAIHETYRYLPEARLADVAAHIQFEGRP